MLERLLVFFVSTSHSFLFSLLCCNLFIFFSFGLKRNYCSYSCVYMEDMITFPGLVFLFELIVLLLSKCISLFWWIISYLMFLLLGVLLLIIFFLLDFWCGYHTWGFCWFCKCFREVSFYSLILTLWLDVQNESCFVFTLSKIQVLSLAFCCSNWDTIYCHICLLSKKRTVPTWRSLGDSISLSETFSTLSLMISLGFNYFQWSFNVRLSMGPNCLLCIDQLYQVNASQTSVSNIAVNWQFIVHSAWNFDRIASWTCHCALTSAMTHMWVVLPRFILSLYIAIAAGGVSKW